MFRVSKGGQAHGLGEDHKHRTESGFQVNLKRFSLYVIIFAFHREKEGHVFPNPHYHRVEEGQEPVNLTGGPLAYKYQFQEMFFHWGEKVNMIVIMVEMVELGSMKFQF